MILRHYNKERAIPYAIGFYPVGKIVSKWDRDLTQTRDRSDV